MKLAVIAREDAEGGKRRGHTPELQARPGFVGIKPVKSHSR